MTTMDTAAPKQLPSLETIREDFAFIEDWEDRYSYIIELGRSLPSLDEAEKNDANKVNGCVSQVWLTAKSDEKNDNPTITFRGDSDAMIVKGLIAIAFGVFSGQRAKTILDTDALAVFEEFGLEEHLTPQRSNGLKAMVERIQAEAVSALQ
ncbi:MAG: SufE family protein [Pseudomonadota bacterium]